MAQVDMFLKLDGVEGESEDPNHPGEIQLVGFQETLTSPRDVGTGQNTGKRRWAHLSLRAKADKSTAMLFKKVIGNEKIPNALLRCYKAGGKAPVEYLTIALSDGYVAKVQVGELESSVGTVIPHCDFELSFGKIVITSNKQTEKGGGSGTIVAPDDLMANQT